LEDQASVVSGYKVLADHVRKVANVPVRNVSRINLHLIYINYLKYIASS